MKVEESFSSSSSSELESPSMPLKRVKTTIFPYQDPVELPSYRSTYRMAVLRHTKSNSQLPEIVLEDIRFINSLSLRKLSCICEACGGEKLAKSFLKALLPKRQKETRRQQSITGLQTLSSLIRKYRKETMVDFPGVAAIRLSQLLGEHPPLLYEPPPITPAIAKFMSEKSLSSQKKAALKHAKVKTIQTSASVHLPKLRIPVPKEIPMLMHKTIKRGVPTLPGVSISTTSSEAKEAVSPRQQSVATSFPSLTTRLRDSERLYAVDKRSLQYPKLPKMVR